MAREPVVDQLNLVVRDMEAAVSFYRLLGLDIPDTMPAFQAHHRSVAGAGPIAIDLDSVEFAAQWDEGWRGGMGVLTFRVDDRERVDELFATLTAAGYRGQQAPVDAFWGARFAVIEDPDGNAVGLMSPVNPERRGDPGGGWPTRAEMNGSSGSAPPTG